jgi:amino acid transporter
VTQSSRGARRARPVGVLPAGLRRRQLGLLPLAMVTFFIVSGGPFGLEELVSESGAGVALLLILVTPLIWSVPTALMVAELSSMMPVEGGYYAWVKKALGPFWGFLEGWWSWLASFVDMAIYPVLFASYLSALLEGFGVTLLAENPLGRWLVALAVIWPCALLNVRGARPVGTTSVLFGILVLAPFIAMVVLGAGQLLGEPEAVTSLVVMPEESLLNALGLGLFVVMWNYSGWDAASTFGEEIREPLRDVPRMLAITVPLVTLAYLLPVAAGLIGSPDQAEWTEGSFPKIAASVGGEWLGTLVAVAGLVSAVALFSANLLSNSRLPFVLAADGYLPAAVTRLHPKHGTPVAAILLSALVYSIFSYSSFAALVVIDVVLYSATILLEFAALLALRARLPQARRSFAVPGGWAGLVAITLLPTALLVLALVATSQTEGPEALIVSGAALASGVVLYPVLRVLVKRGRPDVYVPVVGEGTAEEWKLLTLPARIPKLRPQWR